MSAMRSSLNTNSRRKERDRFKKPDAYKQKPTSYAVPTISESKRDAIVRQILVRRRTNAILGWAVALLCTVMCFLYLVFRW